MSPRPATSQRQPTSEELETAKVLVPFMRAGLEGLERSRWRPSQFTQVEDMVAPIVVAVLVEVAKTLPLAEMTAALEARKETDHA